MDPSILEILVKTTVNDTQSQMNKSNHCCPFLCLSIIMVNLSQHRVNQAARAMILINLTVCALLTISVLFNTDLSVAQS